MKTMTLYRPNAIHGLLGSPHFLGDFDRFFDDSFFAPVAKSFSHLPAVDVRETEKSYVLDMELPGYSEKDIEVHVDGSSLSITSKHEDAREAKDNGAESGKETWILRERRVNTFSRSFKLPENANPAEITAEFKNGVLSMEIKKRAEAQKRAVEIKVA